MCIDKSDSVSAFVLSRVVCVGNVNIVLHVSNRTMRIGKDGKCGTTDTCTWSSITSHQSPPIRLFSGPLNSPGMRVAASAPSCSSVPSFRIRVLSASALSLRSSDRGRRRGDVLSTPGVTGGVGLGVPPANACGGRLGVGSENRR
jgi:hypothetical protein